MGNKPQVLSIIVCSRLNSFVKKEAFIDENEVRLLHDSRSINDTKQVINQIKNGIDSALFKNLSKHFDELIKILHLDEVKYFYSQERGIRSYKELCLSDVWGSGVIPEIIVGPMCRQDITELKKFLKANGLQETKIIKSKVSIR